MLAQDVYFPRMLIISCGRMYFDSHLALLRSGRGLRWSVASTSRIIRCSITNGFILGHHARNFIVNPYDKYDAMGTYLFFHV